MRTPGQPFDRVSHRDQGPCPERRPEPSSPRGDAAVCGRFGRNSSGSRTTAPQLICSTGLRRVWRDENKANLLPGVSRSPIAAILWGIPSILADHDAFQHPACPAVGTFSIFLSSRRLVRQVLSGILSSKSRHLVSARRCLNWRIFVEPGHRGCAFRYLRCETGKS